MGAVPNKWAVPYKEMIRVDHDSGSRQYQHRLDIYTTWRLIETPITWPLGKKESVANGSRESLVAYCRRRDVAWTEEKAGQRDASTSRIGNA